MIFWLRCHWARLTGRNQSTCMGFTQYPGTTGRWLSLADFLARQGWLTPRLAPLAQWSGQKAQEYRIH